MVGIKRKPSRSIGDLKSLNTQEDQINSTIVQYGIHTIHKGKMKQENQHRFSHWAALVPTDSPRAQIMTTPRRRPDPLPSPSSCPPPPLLSRLRSAAYNLMVSRTPPPPRAPRSLCTKHFVEQLAGEALDSKFFFCLLTMPCVCQMREYSTRKDRNGRGRHRGGSSSAPRETRQGDTSHGRRKGGPSSPPREPRPGDTSHLYSRSVIPEPGGLRWIKSFSFHWSLLVPILIILWNKHHIWYH
jgi:hypothetical protein